MNEYNYDSNGNLTKDLNKGITNISYNCLNLPSVVTFSDGSTVTYTYAADGTKLKTVHKTGSTTTTTDYCGNVVYENGVQKLLLTDEGYVTLSDSKYHYYLKQCWQASSYGRGVCYAFGQEVPLLPAGPSGKQPRSPQFQRCC